VPTEQPTPPRSAGPASAGLAPGTIIGPYTLEELLGAGGMGVVYKAKSAGAAEPVALKILHRHHIANPQVTKRFIREAGLLRRLRSEHLVALVDSGEDGDGRLFMALAYVDGDPLDQWLLQHGPPSIRRAVSMAIDVCRALSCCHDEGVIHRDLKPANVLLERLPGPHDERRVRVCDFGLGKALQHETGGGATALTDQNMIFGTPEYMSPEQVRGDDLDPRCDVYAAGVLLYELLTGRAPFRAMTSVMTMTAHLTEQPSPPSRAAPDRGVSPALDAVTLFALAKDPAERYPTATALGEALGRALSSPLDVDGVRPCRPPVSDPELGIRDTALSLSATPVVPLPPAVDPLGSTFEIKGFDASKLPPAEPLSQAAPSSGSRARASSDGKPSQRVTPESLALRHEGGERAWLWVVVAVLAAAVGVAVGLLSSAR
jgi:eukaryotic-like serine/threonine-protein kinase